METQGMENITEKNIEVIENFFKTIPKISVLLIIFSIFYLIVKKQLLAHFQKLINLIYNKIENILLKKFLNGIISLVASPFFSTVITVICPYFMAQFDSALNLIVILWCIILILHVLCNEYIKKADTIKTKKQKLISTSLNYSTQIHNKTQQRIFESMDNIPKMFELISKDPTTIPALDEYHFRFDVAASIACEAIYDIIKEITGYIEHQITIYKRYQYEQGLDCPQHCPLQKKCSKFKKYEWAKMVACCNKERKNSISFDQEHCFDYHIIDKDTVTHEEKIKKHFYLHFFKENITSPKIITGKEQIAKSFLYHDSSKDREEKIEQYIGIPLCFGEKHLNNQLHDDMSSVSKNFQYITYAVIQIDFQNTNTIGKNDDEILDFINTFLPNIITYLEISLQIELMIKKHLTITSQMFNMYQQTHKDLEAEYTAMVKKHNFLVTDYNTLYESYKNETSNSVSKKWKIKPKTQSRR